MASLSNLLGGGTSIDHRKEGLPLFGLFGSTSDQNTHMTFRVFDSGMKMCGSPWGAVCNSTTNYRFGILGDASHAYNMSDHDNDDWTRQLNFRRYGRSLKILEISLSM